MNSRGSKNRRFILSLVTGSLLTLLAAILSGAGRAQTDEEGAQGYVLGSGDILKITVLDELELSGSFQVSSVGKISYPFLGMLSVAGMTVEELDQLLVRELGKDYLVNPVVTISVEEYRSKKVFIQGEVVQPGVYFLKERTGILNLLLESGGTTKDASEEIVVLRASPDSLGADAFGQIRINLKDLLSGDQSQNITVENGDIIFIANASGGQFRTEGRYINIMGEVRKPGNYDYRLGLTVLNVILEAGGFTEYAARNKVKVIKKIGDKQKVIIAKLDDMVNRGNLDQDITLDPGDLVVVPQSLF